MADVASPFGAVPVSSLVSCAYNDKIVHYKIANGYNTNVFYGDFISCLLYTSPSPRDGLLSRMPSSA